MPPKLAVIVPSAIAVTQCAPAPRAMSAPVTAKIARPSASAQSRARQRSSIGMKSSNFQPIRKVSAPVMKEMTRLVGSLTQLTGWPSSMSRSVPPPMAVTVASKEKPNGSMRLRAATSAPDSAKTTRPIVPSQSRSCCSITRAAA